MKNPLALILIILLISNFIYATFKKHKDSLFSSISTINYENKKQESPKTNDKQPPFQQTSSNLSQYINVDNIKVKTLSSAPIMFGYSIQLVEQTLGSPNSIEQNYFEMDEQMATIYKYNGATLYFLNNKLSLFTLTNSNFQISIDPNKPYFSIGGTRSDLANINPIYPSLINNNKLLLYLRKNSTTVDSFISITFSGEHISKIRVIEP